MINADDFGLTHGINAGIINAHEAGIVTSASLMVNGAAAAQAAKLWEKHPQLGIGLHYVEPAGIEIDDPAVLRASLAEQLARFERLTAREPTHLDSHHHVHLEGSRIAIFSEEAAALSVPVRGDGTFDYIGGFYAQWEDGVSDPDHVSTEHLCALVRAEALGTATELACHPAADLVGLRSSYAADRLLEHATLTGPGLRARLTELGVELVTFSALTS